MTISSAVLGSGFATFVVEVSALGAGTGAFSFLLHIRAERRMISGISPCEEKTEKKLYFSLVMC